MAFVSTAHKLGHLFPSHNLPDHVIMYRGQWWIRLDVFCALTGMQTNEFFREYSWLYSRAVRILVGNGAKLRYREYNRSDPSALDVYLSTREVQGVGTTKASRLWIPTTIALKAYNKFEATKPDLTMFLDEVNNVGYCWIAIRPIHLRYVLKRAVGETMMSQRPATVLQYMSNGQVKVVVYDKNDWGIGCSTTDWEKVTRRVEIGTQYSITLVSA